MSSTRFLQIILAALVAFTLLIAVTSAKAENIYTFTMEFMDYMGQKGYICEVVAVADKEEKSIVYCKSPSNQESFILDAKTGEYKSGGRYI